MDDPDLWGLAQRSSLQLSDMVADWIKEPCTGNLAKLAVLGRLMTLLYMIHSDLKELNPNQYETLERRLKGVLKLIEELCTWHMARADISNHYCNLSTLAPYGTLFSLSASSASKIPRSISQQIRKGFLAFASDSSKVTESYLKKLERFSKIKDSSAQHYSAKRRSDQLDIADDIPREVHKKLYRAFERYSKCASSPSRARHYGRLRLKDKLQTCENEVLFDTVFAEAPLIQTSGGLRWQQLQFRISKKSLNKKTVKIACNGSANPVAETKSQIPEAATELGLEDFCQMLGSDYGRARMRLRVLEETLLKLPGPEIPDQHILPASSVPLMSVLELRNLRSTEKLTLAFILAKAIWKFYDSEWMSTPWTSKSIHFMKEHAFDEHNRIGRSQIRPSEPYFAFGLNEAAHNLASDYFCSDDVLFRYPCILALGVLLVEICGRRLTREAGLEAVNLNKQINDDYYDCYDAVHRDKRWPDLKFGEPARETYREVTKVCLSQDIFQQTTDAHERRNILFERVVCPLGRLLKDIGRVDHSGTVKDMEVLPLIPRTTTMNDEPEELSFLVASSNSNQSEIWMNSLIGSTLSKDILASVDVGNHPRVKVAVLDTGCDPDSTFFADRRRRNCVKKWRDFASGSIKLQDQDGHGTHVLSLAMRIAPAADLFVARVGVGAEGLPLESKNVADAITWAAEECQVDIISMSFGYREEVPVGGEYLISNAILQAMSKRKGRIILFAAGGNSGGNQKEMFPACHPFVIPIRSTNHQGTFQEFNSPPDFRGLDVFGTLGNDVSSAWLQHEDTKVQSGTSVATPIAAGIAAMVLADAQTLLLRRNLSTGDVETIKRLWTQAGMRSMFKSISREMMQKCLYLCPKDFAASRAEKRHIQIQCAASQV